MSKNLERDFEEFKQALANVEAVYRQLMDDVEYVGVMCEGVLHDVKHAPFTIKTIDNTWGIMEDLESRRMRLKELSEIMNAEFENALVYYDSLESEYY